MKLDVRTTAAVALALSALSLSACAAPEPSPAGERSGGGSEDGPVGEAEQAVLDCQGGSAYQISCYNDADGDGRGAGAPFSIWVCSGTCATHGHAGNGLDCNDSNASRWQNLSCYTDGDGDGYVASLAAATVCAGATCESVAGKVSTTESGLDCNDSNASRWRNLSCYTDGDGDGYVASLAAATVCAGSTCESVAGKVSTTESGLDCNDSNASWWHLMSCYPDADGDGHPASLTAATVCAGSTCESVPGKSGDGGGVVDCDDASSARFHILSCHVDADGDHFGTDAAVQTCAGAHCLAGTSGVAYNTGDCDDSNPAIHPQLLETAEDGIDNDCENGVDQAEFFFDDPGVSTNGTTGITMSMRLRNATERAAALAGNLSAKIYYKKLEQASAGWQVFPSSGTTPMTVVSCVAGGLCKVSVTLPNLDPSSVYTADLELFRTGNGTRIFPYGKDGLSSECGYQQPGSHCFNTDILYSMTKGDPGTLRDARWGIVMTALDEVGKFRNTDMGYWSSALKNELELESNDSVYCSEFYSSSAKDYLVDMNSCEYASDGSTPQCDPAETSDAESSIPRMRQWFDAYGPSQSYEYVGPDMSAVKPGDWLGVIPSTEHPDGQHTQMFLAWDAAVSKFWFVEGNGFVTATWNADPTSHYEHSINVDQHHHCGSGAPKDATCGSNDYYVQRVGHLSANMVDQ